MSYVHPEYLVDTEWVAAHLNDPKIRIIESDEDPLLYPMGHIPGAVQVDWFNTLQHPVRRDFLTKEQFEEVASKLGIANDTTVVFYGDKSNWFACYALWLFQYYGHGNVKIMNGGRLKWEQEGRPLTKEVPSYPAASYRAKNADPSIRAFRDEVLQQSNAGKPLVDVRSPKEYSGELISMPNYPQEGATRGGHIPGAVSIPWAQAVNEADSTFKSPGELRALYEGKGIKPDEEVIEGVPYSLEPYPEETLLNVLDETVRQRPNHIAIIFKGKRLTYGKLEKLSDAFANTLVALGIRKGDRVAFLLPNSPQSIIAQLGVWKAGGIAVPINTLYTEVELEHLLNECGAETVVVLTRFYKKVKALQPRTSVRRIIATNIKEYLPPLLSLLFTLFREKREGHRIKLQSNDLWLSQLLRQHAGLPRPDVKVRSEDPALRPVPPRYSSPRQRTSQASCAGASVAVQVAPDGPPTSRQRPAFSGSRSSLTSITTSMSVAYRRAASAAGTSTTRTQSASASWAPSRRGSLRSHSSGSSTAAVPNDNGRVRSIESSSPISNETTGTSINTIHHSAAIE